MNQSSSDKITAGQREKKQFWITVQNNRSDEELYNFTAEELKAELKHWLLDTTILECREVSPLVQSPHPHNPVCSIGETLPLGTPGCICVVTTRKHLRELEELEAAAQAGAERGAAPAPADNPIKKLLLNTYDGYFERENGDWVIEEVVTGDKTERILCFWYMGADGNRRKREVAVLCDWNSEADRKLDELYIKTKLLAQRGAVSEFNKKINSFEIVIANFRRDLQTLKAEIENGHSGEAPARQEGGEK